jgi:hypothetical protein
MRLTSLARRRAFARVPRASRASRARLAVAVAVAVVASSRRRVAVARARARARRAPSRATPRAPISTRAMGREPGRSPVAQPRAVDRRRARETRLERSRARVVTSRRFAVIARQAPSVGTVA